MKLPAAVQTRVRQLEPDPSNVKNLLMVQDARRGAFNAAADLGISYKLAKDQAKLSSALTASASEYNKLLTHLSENTAIDITSDPYIDNDLREEIATTLDGDLEKLKNKDGQIFLPSYEVRGLIHDYQVKKLSERGRGFVGDDKTLLSKFNSGLARQTNKGANSILALDIKQEKAEMSAAGDMFYSNAVQAGDAVLAYDIIESMAEGGLWEPEKVAAHVNKVEGDVQYGAAINELTTGDAMTARAVQAGLGSAQNRMSDSQQWDIYQKSENLLLQRKNERERLIKEVSKENLSESIYQLGSQGVMQWSEVKARGKSMEPVDYMTLINSQRAMLNSTKSTVDNPAVLQRLTSAVGRLAVDGDVPHNIRKQGVITELHEAMGWDEGQQKYTGAAQITSASYFKLLDQVNTSDTRLISDPRLNIQIDKVWRQLTGAGKDMVSNLTGDHKNVIAASEYEYDILNAKLMQGEGFDAAAWHKSNWKNYAISELAEGRKLLLDSRVMNYAIPKSGVKINSGNLRKEMDATETIESIKEALKNGAINDEAAIELIDYVGEISLSITEE